MMFNDYEEDNYLEEPIEEPHIECSHCRKEIFAGDKYYFDSNKSDYYCLDCEHKYLESAIVGEKELLDFHAYGERTKDGDIIFEGGTYYAEEYDWYFSNPQKFLESAIKVMDEETIKYERSLYG